MKKLAKLILLFLLSQTGLNAVDNPPPGRWTDAYLAGLKPEMDITGRYRMVDSSIRRGEAPDINPGFVYRYGNAFKGKIDGKHYWMVPVRYYKCAPSASIYSQARVLAEAYACVYFGKVEMWVPRYIRRFGL